MVNESVSLEKRNSNVVDTVVITNGVEIDINDVDCFDKTVIIEEGASEDTVKIGTKAENLLVRASNCTIEVDGSITDTISISGDNVKIKIQGDACNIFAQEGEKNEIKVNGRITGKIELTDTTHIA